MRLNAGIITDKLLETKSFPVSKTGLTDLNRTYTAVLSLVYAYRGGL
jgi:hypothetical protein